MSTVKDQIRNADRTITDNIATLSTNRALLSRNLLSQMRNLIEGLAVCIHTGNADVDFDYAAIESGVAHMRSNGKLSSLRRFHDLLKISASHYTLDGDASERLMLKYYEHLHRLRDLARDSCGMAILANLEAFPVDLDPSLREYHLSIADRIDAMRDTPSEERQKWDRYYIRKVRPFFVNGRIYYEVTFTAPVDRASKFDRIIAFTHVDMTDKYAARLILANDGIEVLGQSMPILIIRDWQVSIRPCELDNFARLLGQSTKVNPGNVEYRYVMNYLTTNAANLLDIIDAPDEDYAVIRAAALERAQTPRIMPMLDEVRRIVRANASGTNVLRYLMLRMNNVIIKQQYTWDGCERLSSLKLSYGCIPFETMPFCTSLPGHNPRFTDLAESLEVSGRDHELLARRIKNNIEIRGVLYTPIVELEDLGDVVRLVAAYNAKLYYKHTARRLIIDMGHVFVREYEDGTVAIIEKLQQFAGSGVGGYSTAVDVWLEQPTTPEIDDPLKHEALQRLFDQSRVAVIYGAAGTGKSTMVNHIASYFGESQKLFIAQTNPAVDNLKRRVNAPNSTFSTISGQLRRADGIDYDVLFIDECSTVSNADLLKVLETVPFKLIVLVGDVFQIESIQFGNWFRIINSFIPATAVFELTTPYRTRNRDLLGLWSKVRNIDDDIAEALASNRYSSILDGSLFQAQEQDEIILCLNYDGLYGINNINRFLQSSNTGKAVVRGAVTYRVGDPVLFNETDRFKPLIYNNLKGRIVDVSAAPGKVSFDIELDRPVSELDTWGLMDLTWVEGSTVRFDVFESGDGDDDAEPVNVVIPFQVAYAVSIHKAQGLEYDSVKVVVTDANEEDVTHSIFYTAITRAREKLRIFWTPETQQAVLQDLAHSSNNKDVSLLVARRGLETA